MSEERESSDFTAQDEEELKTLSRFFSQSTRAGHSSEEEEEELNSLFSSPKDIPGVKERGLQPLLSSQENISTFEEQEELSPLLLLPPELQLEIFHHLINSTTRNNRRFLNFRGTGELEEELGNISSVSKRFFNLTNTALIRSLKSKKIDFKHFHVLYRSGLDDPLSNVVPRTYNLYFRSSFPEEKNLESYKNSYILVKKSLQHITVTESLEGAKSGNYWYSLKYVTPEGKYENVKITDFKMLLNGIFQFTTAARQNKDGMLCIGSLQVRNWITLNGGHAPSGDYNVIEYVFRYPIKMLNKKLKRIFNQPMEKGDKSIPLTLGFSAAAIVVVIIGLYVCITSWASLGLLGFALLSLSIGCGIGAGYFYCNRTSSKNNEEADKLLDEFKNKIQEKITSEPAIIFFKNEEKQTIIADNNMELQNTSESKESFHTPIFSEDQSRAVEKLKEVFVKKDDGNDDKGQDASSLGLLASSK